MTNTAKCIRALHILGHLTRGGLETWLMDVVRNTDRNQLQIDVCVTSPAPGAYEDEFKGLGGRVLKCYLNPRNPLSFYLRLKQLLKQEKYDVVHSHCYYFSGVVLRAAAKAGIRKRVAHIHPAVDHKIDKPFRGFYTWYMKRWIEQYGTNFVGPTKASLEGFWGKDWEEDSQKRVIYNGIKIERFIQPVSKQQVHRLLGVPEDGKIVLDVSRFVPHKRHEFLVRVAEIVLSKRQNVYFLLIGDGPLKEKIITQVRTKAIYKNFRFLSGIPNIDEYIMAADLFVFPSCNEGFGIVLIEAAAAGLKIIAQDIPGVREAVKVCPDAILLSLDTPADEWARILLETLELPHISESHRQRRLKEFYFTIENSIANLKEVYNS